MTNYDAMEVFVRNVEAAMVRNGMNKQDLADKLGMNRSQLSKIVRGKNAATLRTLDSIAKGLGMELFELFVPESVVAESICDH